MVKLKIEHDIPLLPKAAKRKPSLDAYSFLNELGPTDSFLWPKAILHRVRHAGQTRGIHLIYRTVDAKRVRVYNAKILEQG